MAGYYVATHDYTYIAKKQSEIVTKYRNQWQHHLHSSDALFAVGVLYYIWKKWNQRKIERKQLRQEPFWLFWRAQSYFCKKVIC